MPGKTLSKKTSKVDGHFETLFDAKQGEQLVDGFKLIPRGSIERRAQPRRSFPADQIGELAASIAELKARGEGIAGTGILQPLLVTQAGDGYRLIAGERRYRASEIAGLEQLPAIVVATDESGVLLAQLVENLQRRDLPPLEEARGIDQLMQEQELSEREAARVLGKDRGYLQNRLRLLKMRPDVQEMVAVRTSTLQHARLIHPIEDEALRRQLIAAALDGAGEREIRRLIEDQTTAQAATATATGEAKAETLPDTHSSPNPQTDDPAATKVDVRTSTSPGDKSQKAMKQADGGDRLAAPPDPLSSALRPAVAFAAEFGRQVQTLRMTRDYRQAVTKELEQLKREIEAIEKKLKAANK